MKTIVVSGANIRYGGNLSIFYDCLDELITTRYNDFRIIAFVSDKHLFEKYLKRIEIVERKEVLKSYIKRLTNEYLYYYKYSKEQKIDIWLSLNDFSPSVIANKRYTYCHNPLPFYNMKLSDIKYSITTYLMTLFFQYIYKKNIEKLDGVIVQQNWMKKEIIKKTGISGEKIIIAQPNISSGKITSTSENNKSSEEYKFIYPVYPRFFKKIDIVCEAARRLEQRGITNFKLLLTLKGDENTYAKSLYKKYRNSKVILFMGFQDREEILKLYDCVQCLVFASELETWGMPISEFKQTGKNMILVDKEYTHETLGIYKNVCFFESNNVVQVSQHMENEIKGNAVFCGNRCTVLDPPFFENWKKLFAFIMEN